MARSVLQLIAIKLLIQCINLQQTGILTKQYDETYSSTRERPQQTKKKAHLKFLLNDAMFF